jgi:hypothetical protein
MRFVGQKVRSYRLRHWLFLAGVLLAAASPVAALVTHRLAVAGVMISVSVLAFSIAAMLVPDEDET